MTQNVIFDVLERPVHVNDKEVPSRKAIVNAETKEVIGIVGKNYVPVSNRQILEHFGKIADENNIEWRSDKGYLLRGGSKTIMEIIFPSIREKVTRGDIIELRGYLINSFDGNSSAKLELGYLRLVCENGMMIREREMVIAYKHIGNVNEKLVKQFRLYLNEKIETSKVFIRSLVDLKFDGHQVLDIIGASRWISKKYHENLIAESEKLNVLNGWYLYNVFTYVITHLVKVNMENRLRLLKKLNKEARKWKEIE